MAAETGSGKTAAFCLPIIQIVWETLKDIQSGKAAKAATSVCKSNYTKITKKWGYKICMLNSPSLDYVNS